MKINTQLFERIIQDLPNYIFVKDLDLIYKLCNKNFVEAVAGNPIKQFADKISYFDKEKGIKNSEILKQFFDRDCPIYIVYDKEKSFDIVLLQNIVEKTSPNLQLKLITPAEWLFKKSFLFKKEITLFKPCLIYIKKNYLR